MTLSPTVPALERQRRLARLAQQRQIDAEDVVRRLAAGDRLEDQIDRRAALDRGQRRRHMGQHAGLRRELEPLAQRVEKVAVSSMYLSRLSVAGLMPITASPDASISPSRIDAAMPCRSSVGWFGCSRVDSRPGQADRVAEAGHDPALARRPL